MSFRNRLSVTIAAIIITTNALSSQLQEKKTINGLQSRDMVLFNGKIFTSNEDQLWAQALLIKGAYIKAVGDNDEILAMAGKATEKIDLEGRLLIPGINDAHAHSFAWPEHVMLNDPNTFIPNAGPGLDEFLELLEARVQTTPEGTWIFAIVGTRFFEDPNSNRFALDSVAPNHPVMFFTWGGHGRVINTNAMIQAGISNNEENPPGGEYERDENGVLTGVLHEYAEHRLARYLKTLVPIESARNQYEAFARGLVKRGVTTVQDMDIGYEKSSVEFVLAGMDVPLHWRAICFPLSPDESCKDSIRQNLFKNGALRAYSSGIKYILDGSPVEGHAALRDPYNNINDWTGVFNWERDFTRIVAQGTMGNPQKNQLIFHAVGDRATDRILAELEKTGSPEFWQTRRVRVEHGAILWPEQIAKMVEYGVVYVHNPIFTVAEDLIQSRFGPERAKNYQPVRSAMEAGVMVGFGSDTGRVAGNPYLELAFSLIHMANPSEVISLEQALIAYTLGSAYAEFTENIKGSLEPGKLADLAVLSQNIFEIRADFPEILSPEDQNNLIGRFFTTRSLFTMVAGSIAYDEGVLDLD